MPIQRVSSLDLTQPFTYRAAAEAGIPRHRLRSAGFRPVIHGVYISRDIPDTLVVRAKAALLVAPEFAVLSHETAARLWCPQGPKSARTHLSFSYDAHLSREELSVHRFTYRLETAHRHGLLVTTPAMTFMHLAVRLELVELVIFGDQLVKRRLISTSDLVSYAENWENHGRSAGLRAARLVRDGVDSSPETRLRLLIVLAGVAEPKVNHVIYHEDGAIRHRIELVYEEIRLAIEYDGRWHDDEEQQAYDVARRGALADEGWTFLIVRAEGLFEKPLETLQEIVEAMRSLGVEVDDPDLSDVHRHFAPVRVA